MVQVRCVVNCAAHHMPHARRAAAAYTNPHTHTLSRVLDSRDVAHHQCSHFSSLHLRVTNYNIAAGHSSLSPLNCLPRPPPRQNILENYPPFLMLLAVGSTYRPALAAAFGALRLFGFISYYKGYSSGDPKKRLNPGTAVGYIGLFGLLGLGFEVVARLITS
eukprot:TRINITY_DN590_c0_g1_i1.p2 TRINITY_DN590_c0_g1~~TRINITY_DN590_c0_g1_i1.p2  ORF type:complete len:162 (-),score=33.23 TRINITY_DN590_c0_g1_i1:380-865(-)